MRALVVKEFAPYANHAIEELADPEPAPDEVVIDARAMSLNFPDVLIVEGLYQHKPARPFIPGFDAAGVVSAVGAEVSGFEVGDRVLTSRHHGAFATRIQAPVSAVYKIPDMMPFEDAAAFGLVYLTAQISMVENAAAKAGETILVTGASGGVGLAMVQLGAALGMDVIGGVTSAQKADVVQANGAFAAIDLAAANLREAVREQVYRLTDDEGVDLVLDQVGGDVFDACLRALKPGGRIAVVGFAGGRIAEVKTNYLLIKRLTVIGSPLTSGRSDGDAVRRKAMAKVLALYEAGKLKPHISASLAFDEWREAFRRFKDREVIGKIVLLP